MSEHENGKIPPHEQEPMKKEWWEVVREKEVGFVGDLNGSVKALLKNLVDLGYINVKDKTTQQLITNETIEKLNELALGEINNFLRNTVLEWTGDSKKIILLGDILGDRMGNGDIALEITDFLEEKGADLTVIGGNHDVGAIRGLIAGSPFGNRLHNIPDQAPMTEYREFEDLSTGGYEIERMYSTEHFVKHVREIKKMKVAEMIDDTLFIHAGPDPEKFIALYQKYNSDGTLSAQQVVEKWNKAFHDALESAFPEIPGPFGTIIDHTNIQTRKFDFDALCQKDELLSVLSGWPANKFFEKNVYPPSFFLFLKERGINALVFGHEATFETFTQENVTIIPADGKSERSGEPENMNYSNGKIETNGHIPLSVGKNPREVVRSR